MNIVYIHGNGASAASFNYIRTQLSEYPEILLEYQSADGFYENLERMREALDGIDDIFFVAHSLGGIYALHLAHALEDKVSGAVTLSTPYGGSEAAELVKYMLPFNRVIQEIRPRSAPIEEANKFDIKHPWTNIVTLDGHSPFMVAANDGVVTRDSMRHREDIRLIEVMSSHYEVVLHEETVAIIRSAIAQAGEQRLMKGDDRRRHG
jgi:pimeloyl-ACP methyl ester carboxylesterase